MLTDTPAIVPPIETQPETNLWFTAKELRCLLAGLERLMTEVSPMHVDHRDYELLVERVNVAIARVERIATKKNRKALDEAEPEA
jgi:hypothetical protein